MYSESLDHPTSVIEFLVTVSLGFEEAADVAVGSVRARETDELKSFARGDSSLADGEGIQRQVLAIWNVSALLRMRRSATAVAMKVFPGEKKHNPAVCL